MILMTAGLLILERIPGLDGRVFAVALLLIALPGSIAVASLSFVFIERPFMRLGSRLAKARAAPIPVPEASAESRVALTQPS
jgi:peptidoglycan/LPS O-acetylase OafA/YrhL